MYGESEGKPIIFRPNGLVGIYKCKYSCTRIISASKTVSIPAISRIALSFEPVESRKKSSPQKSLPNFLELERKSDFIPIKMERVLENSQSGICDVIQISDNYVTNINNPFQLLKGNIGIENSATSFPKSVKNLSETKDKLVYINCLNFNFHCKDRFEGRKVEESKISLSGIPVTNTAPQRCYLSEDGKSTQTYERKQLRAFNVQSFQKHLSLKSCVGPRSTRAKSAICLQRSCLSNVSRKEDISNAKDLIETLKKGESSVTFCSVGSSSYPLIDKQYYTEIDNYDNKRVDFNHNRSMYKQFQYNDFQNSRFNKVIHPNRSATTLCANSNYFKNQKRLRRLNIS